MLTNERLKEIKHDLAKWSLVYRHINTDHAIAAIDELAAIKSAPGMAEVDALSGDFTVEECDQPCLTIWMQRNKKLADLARRSIAAREEVVGLLKEAKEYNLLGEMEHMALFRGDEPSVAVRVSKAILEIVEGK